MMEDPAPGQAADAVEAALRDRFARDEAAAGSVIPILRHLLANEDNSIFSEEIVARVRGMVGDMAMQLLDRHSQADEAGERAGRSSQDADALSEAIIAQPALLGHVHALALEWQLTERLQARLALDPVLPPLLQSLIASTEAETAALAMQLLAAQARFCQAQRRMRLPLTELPGDLLHSALLAMRTVAGGDSDEAETAIRADYDESRGRLGLLARLVAAMGGGAVAALSVSHAGAAIFLTALAAGSGQTRDSIALATNEAQLARLALALRAAGLKPSDIEEQFLAIHPDLAPPSGFERLGPDRAAALLSAGALPDS
jgi:hypothetical protein